MNGTQGPIIYWQNAFVLDVKKKVIPHLTKSGLKWFNDKIHHLSRGGILVTGYNSIDDYVTAECRTCGNTWWPKAYELYQNCKCPYCKVKKQPLKVKVKVKRKKG